MEQGRLADLAPGTVILSDERAKSDGTKVGDTVTATVAGTDASFGVVGVYRVSPGLGTPFLVSLDALDELGWRRPTTWPSSSASRALTRQP